MGYITSKVNKLVTETLSAIGTFISVEKRLTYSEPFDFTADNARDIPDIGKVAEMISGGGGGLIPIELFGSVIDWTDLGDGFWSAPLPALEDDKTYATLMKVYPDQTDLATYYFKVPEPESGNLINIEWDGVSDIKILIKIG